MHYAVLHLAVHAPRAGLWTAGTVHPGINIPEVAGSLCLGAPYNKRGSGKARGEEDQFLFLAMENLAYFTVYLERKKNPHESSRELISSWTHVDFSFPSHRQVFDLL